MENNKITYGKAVALRLQEIIDTYNFTKNKLAELCNIPSATITVLLQGKYEYPSQKSILAICNYLNMDLQEFFNSPYFYKEFLQYKD